MSTPPPFPSRRAARAAAHGAESVNLDAAPAADPEHTSQVPDPLDGQDAPQADPGFGYPVRPQTSPGSWPGGSAAPEPPTPTRRPVPAPHTGSPTQTLETTIPPVLPPDGQPRAASHADPRTPPGDISETSRFDSAELASVQMPRPSRPEPVPPERVAILPTPPAAPPTPIVPERRSIKPAVGADGQAGLTPGGMPGEGPQPVAGSTGDTAAWTPEEPGEDMPSFEDLLGGDYVEDEPEPAGSLAAASPQWSDEDLFPTPTTRPDPHRAAGPTPKRRRTAGDVVRGIVGVFGELLVTIGVILLLFVAWELWWTDYTGNKEQLQAVEQLNDSPGWVPAPVKAPEVGVQCTVSGSNPAECGGETPPQDVTNPGSDPFAVLQVPRWGSTWDQANTYAKPISEGTNPTVLNTSGVGHYNGTNGNPSSQMVADVGNFALAAHRRTHGAPFRNIQELKDGDDIIVQTANYYYVYTVKASKVVYPDDSWVVGADPVDPSTGKAVIDGADKRLITLTTCHPEFSTTERYIVWGELSYWTPKTGADGQAAVPQTLISGEGS